MGFIDSMTEPDDKKVIVIGGGPAGLTAAYSLSQRGVKSVVLEKDDVVGGISRTVREFISGIENLQLVGRNGMHRYNILHFLQKPC